MIISSLLAAIFATILTVQGQQFDGYIFPHDLLGLNQGCFEVVNRTVSSCPAWLPRYAGLEGASVEMLPSEQLTVLCESSSSTDVMVPNKFAYPATFLVDRFLYAASLSCLKDKASRKYCDLVVADWINQPNYTSSQTCSQCELGVLQIQLASPFGFSDTLAEAFADTTKSCSAANYAFATPTSYALNATTFPNPSACTGSAYTIKQDDSCVTISAANGMSTYQLITKNNLNLGCDNLPAVGQSLCLPTGSTCRTYQLDLYDTCKTLMMSWNATLAQVLAWNPMINSACSNLASWRGWYLCSSSPSGTVSVGSGNAVATPAPAPSNAQGQSNASLTLSDFYFLNPQVDSSCSNLWANTSYCVKPVGNIETYSGYKTTTAATTFTRPVTATDFVPSPVQTATLQPKASGTIRDCYVYENAFDATSKLKNLSAANSCCIWAQYANVTVEQLLEWNPSLSGSNCVLQAGKSYCIQKWETPHNFNCSMVPDLFGITVAELTRLNPWIGSNCDTGIWSKLTSDGYEQVCVLRSGGQPTGSQPPQPV
ncbi:LysM domain-containing protein ARB_00327 [Trichoderma asperellum]|uniref:LysM domain-containing protein ARB_00327 n=1 Tax=Trichoderma asperellum TaxID=101201 RepID=A0A6V8QTF1_TRIAP|nr:LysM domain-containing protein ARB_00327 [Trichoderma asperellum]